MPERRPSRVRPCEQFLDRPVRRCRAVRPSRPARSHRGGALLRVDHRHLGDPRNEPGARVDGDPALRFLGKLDAFRGPDVSPDGRLCVQFGDDLVGLQAVPHVALVVAGQPRDRNELGQCLVRRDLRLQHRRHRDDGASRRSRDAPLQVRQGARHVGRRGIGHDRCDDSAEHPVRHLCLVCGGFRRRTVHGGRGAGNPDRRRLHGHDHHPVLPQSRACAAGAARFLQGGAAQGDAGCVAAAIAVCRDLRRPLHRRRNSDRSRGSQCGAALW